MFNVWKLPGDSMKPSASLHSIKLNGINTLD